MVIKLKIKSALYLCPERANGKINLSAILLKQCRNGGIMKQKMKKLFYKARRWLAAALCVILFTQAAEPLLATITDLSGKEGRHIALRKVPGVDSDVYESMDLYIEQRGEIFALDLEFCVAANAEADSSEEETATQEASSEELTMDGLTDEETSETEGTEEAESEEDTAEDGKLSEEAGSEEITSEEITTEEITTEEITSDEIDSEEITSAETSSEEISAGNNPDEEEKSAENSSKEQPAEESGLEDESHKGKDEPSSDDMEVEKIVREMEANYAQQEAQEVSLLEAAETEKLNFDIDFTDAFYQLDKAGDYHVLNEKGKPIGSFELSENGDRLTLSAEFEVRKERFETVGGSLHFSLGNTSGEEGDVKLLWNEEAGAVDVKVEKKENLLTDIKEWLLRGVFRAQNAKAGSGVYQTSILDLRSQLASPDRGYVQRMFESLTMEIQAERANGKAEGTDLLVTLSGKMDDEYLSAALTDELIDTYGEYLNKNGSAAKSLYEWLRDDSLSGNVEFPENMGFQVFLKDSSNPLLTFLEGINDEQSHKLVTEAGGQRYELGSWELVKETDGIVMKFTILPAVIAMHDVSLGSTFRLECEAQLEDKYAPKFNFVNGAIQCEAIERCYAEGEPSPKNGYILSKTALTPDSENTPYADYEVTAEAFDSLAGCKLVETLPQGVELSAQETAPYKKRITLQYEGKSAVTLLEAADKNNPGADEFVLNGRELIYVFPDELQDGKAVFTVKTVLTAEALAGMMNHPDGAKEKTFENKAKLIHPDDPADETVQDSATVKKKYQMFAKSGEQDPEDGNRMNWTIDIRLSYKNCEDIYLVDSLPTAEHNYIDGSTVQLEKYDEQDIQVGSETIDLREWTQAMTGSIAYSDVTADTLRSQITDKASDKNGAYYYSEDGTGTDVMMLLLDSYLTGLDAAKGYHLKIKYSTRIAQNSFTTDSRQEYHNYADLRWNIINWGYGPGTWDSSFSYTVDKPATAVVNVVTKQAGAYNADKRLQAWQADVNFYGGEHKNMVLTEDFAQAPLKGTQTMPGADEFKCQIIKSSSAADARFQAGTDIPKGSAGSAAPYYEIAGDKLNIHLGDVSAKDYFTVEFLTKVSGGILENQTDGKGNITGPAGGKNMLKNKITVTTDDMAAGITVESEAELPFINTLITKDALKPGSTLGEAGAVMEKDKNGYNAETKELKWRLTVNPNSYTIDDAVILDNLPPDNLFSQVTGVIYGESKSADFTADSAPNQYSGLDSGKKYVPITAGMYLYIERAAEDSKEIKFKIVSGENSIAPAKQMDKPLQIEYTTKLTQDLLNKMFTLNGVPAQELGDGVYHKNFTNAAALSGTIKAEYDAVINPAVARDDAVHKAEIDTLYKSAEYDGKGGLTWRAVINQGQGGIDGLTLQEELDSRLEYVNDSFKIYEFQGYQADGSVKKGGELPVSGAEQKFTILNDEKGNPKGFSVSFGQIGGGDNTRAYYIEFQTIIAENVKKVSDVANKLSLLKGNDTIQTSNSASADSNDSFSTDQYVTGSLVPMLLIEKVSSSKNENGDYKLKFQDVEFKITEQKWDGSNAKWTDGPVMKNKETNENGRRIFVGFSPNKLYKVEEIEAPAGYTKMKDIYLYYQGDKEFEEIYPADATKPEGMETWLNTKLFNKKVITNEPNNAGTFGRVKFIKTNTAATPEKLNGATFRLIRKDGKVAEKEAVSGTSNSANPGLVEFVNVDPGEYTLVEESADADYALLGKADVTVSAPLSGGGPGGYSIKLSSGTVVQADFGADEAALPQIENELAAVHLEITKKDRETNAVLAGAKFTLTGTDAVGNAVSMEGTSDNRGMLIFENIPVSQGYYVLKEDGDGYPAGYHQDAPTQYRVTVKGEGNKAKLTLSHFDGAPITQADKDIVFTDKAAGVKAACTIYNMPIRGRISFVKTGKTRETDAASPLNGAKFGLFRQGTKEADITEEKAVDVAISKNTAGADGAVRDGTVLFENIPYGDYFIRELEAPAGYILNTVQMTVNRSGLVIAGDKNSFVCVKTQEDKLLNQTWKADVNIQKSDQNMAVLQGVEFKLERYGTQVDTPDGITDAQLVDYPITGSSPAGNMLTTDAAGRVELGSLIYGAYKLTETTGPSDIIGTAPPIYVKVGLKADKTVGVMMYMEKPDNLSPADMTGGTLIEAVSGSYTIPVVNELKFGLIQMNKAAATKQTVGSNVTYSISVTGGKPNTIAEAYFEIYKTQDVIPESGTAPAALKPNAKPYVTLKTNAKGQFDYIMEGDEKYSYEEVYALTKDGHNKGDKTGRKVKLILGEYYIREVDTPSGYVLDKSLYPFELRQSNYDNINNSDNTRFEWISNTGSANVELNHSKISDSYFVNEIVRTEVSLDKVKRDGAAIDTSVKLKDAAFIIYTDEAVPKAVASLKWDESEGKYYLSGENPLKDKGVIFTMNNAQGIPYVVYNTAAGRYAIISGSYFVDEAAAPKGYMVEKDSGADGFEGRKKHRFTIDSDMPKILSNETPPNDTVFSNRLGRGSVLVRKTIDVNGAKEECITEAQKIPNDFKFTLTMVTTDSGVDYGETSELISGGDSLSAGKAEFKNVPFGNYILKEEANTREGYRLMDSLELEVSETGTRIVTDIADRTDVAYNRAENAVEVTNRLVRSDITGYKYGVAGQGYNGADINLPGAVFALYRDSACTVELCEADAPTDAQGKFTFSGIPYGTYYVKEKKAPDGYEASDGIASVTVGQDAVPVEIARDTFKNTVKKAAVELVKTDVQTGAPVSGAVFSVYGNDAEGNGKDKVVAYLTESGTRPGTYVLNRKAGDEIAADYVNATGMGCLLFNPAENQYYLSAGNYYYRETATPEHYQENPQRVDFTVAGTAAGDIKILDSITNTRETTDIKFTKVDKKNGYYSNLGKFTQYGIAGIQFTLYDDISCTNTVQTAESSGNNITDKEIGSVAFVNLEPGVYYFKETQMPVLNGTAMYQQSDTVYTFTVDSDVSDGVDEPRITMLGGPGEEIRQIENTAEPSLEVSLAMDLKTPGGQPLANAEFELRRNGILYARAGTDANGYVDFGKVLPADYTLTQIDSVNGYIPIAEPIEQKVENPILTGVRSYHIPVINDKPAESGKDADNQEKGGKKGSSGSSVADGIKGEAGSGKLSEISEAAAGMAIGVMPSEFISAEDVQAIKQFLENPDITQMTEKELAANEVWREAWKKEFETNGEYWREKFGMSEEEWSNWMERLYYSNYVKLPKTGGLMASVAAAALGIALVGFGAYETFGRGKRKCFKRKKK